jgi:hypothetical protein
MNWVPEFTGARLTCIWQKCLPKEFVVQRHFAFASTAIGFCIALAMVPVPAHAQQRPKYKAASTGLIVVFPASPRPPVYFSPALHYQSPQSYQVRAVASFGQPAIAYAPRARYLGPLKVDGQPTALYLHPSLVSAQPLDVYPAR